MGGHDATAASTPPSYFRTQPEFNAWNAETSSYYSAAGGELNHHILCVGWDDSYPADAFLAGHRPPGDGAFLIKNSWGTDFADQGYLWVSYYDASFGKALAVFNGVASVDDHDAIYQYDALGRSAWIAAGGGESAWYANRFTGAGSGRLTAVSFYTPVPGTAYEVRVARLAAGHRRGAGRPPAGTIAVGGYHTVRLQQPAGVTAGDPFVVAVRVTTPGWTEPVPVEAPVGSHRAASARGAVVRERRRLVVDRPHVAGHAARRSARERLPQGVRGRGRAPATRGRRSVDAPRRRRAPRRHGDDPLAARRPGLLQRQRDRRAQRARRRRQRRWPGGASPPSPWESAGSGA